MGLAHILTDLPCNCVLKSIFSQDLKGIVQIGYEIETVYSHLEQDFTFLSSALNTHWRISRFVGDNY